MHLYLLDPKTGAQWDNAQEVRIKLVQPDKDIEFDATTRKAGPGHYVIEAAALQHRWDMGHAGERSRVGVRRVLDHDRGAGRRALTTPRSAVGIYPNRVY